jgi:hypothetical protein
MPQTVSLRANNRIWLTYSHFPYKSWNAVAELIDNSTQSYIDNRKALDKQLKKDKARFAVRIDLDRKSDLFSVVDNAMGMDLDDLRRAVQLAAPPDDTSGRSEFGMGMKTSCSWLGEQWSIITKKLGTETEYTVTIDIPQIAQSEAPDLPVTEKHAGSDEHYTRIEVRKLHPRFPGRSLGKTKEYLVQIYRSDVEKDDLEIWWNGEKLVLPPIHPLETDSAGKKTIWKKDVSFEVDDNPVNGWVCILGEGERGREKAGFDLYRRGRVIIGRPNGYRPFKIFGESRNDLINQRIYGQLNLDTFPVNHLKDDFLWDGLEEKLQDKLVTVCKDYLQHARTFRAQGEKNKPVTQAVVKTANDEMATELTEDEMEEQLAFIDIMEVPEAPDPAVIKAKAARLRAQKIEPRIFDVGKRRFRIYHPQDMPDTDMYFFRQSAQDDEIDIFINDNHPFVAAAAADEPSYLMFVRMCVFDAIVEHELLHRETQLSATFPARLKDVLLRGVGV